MIQIDRMEIDDVGGNPAKLARAILKQIPNLMPPIPVREIAAAVGIYEIREEDITNLEGGLVAPDDKSMGAILVNLNRPETRKRYTIGHELGHFLNPWHKPSTSSGFRCGPKEMALDAYKALDRDAQMEVEANEFAAELLLPKAIVDKYLKKFRGVELEQIMSMATDFFVSKEAAARTYVTRASEPVAMIFSKNGKIRYAKRAVDFPALNCWSGDPLPVYSHSTRDRAPIGRTSDWATMVGDIWLQNARGQEVCEQTIAQENGFRMTLLALSEE